MTTQLEMDLSKRTLAQDLAKLTDFLLPHAKPVKASVIRDALGLNERRVRKLAEMSKGEIVSGPGSNGYKHRSQCSDQERAEMVARLRSQIKHMEQRAAEIE